jgi:hypothetical protein
MTDIQKRIEMERKVVAYMIDRAIAHGFTPGYVFDSEERVQTPSKQEMIDAIFSVDISVAYFKHPVITKNHCAVIILGNDGWDAIADSSMGEGWDEVMEEVSAFADELCA